MLTAGHRIRPQGWAGAASLEIELSADAFYPLPLGARWVMPFCHCHRGSGASF